MANASPVYVFGAILAAPMVPLYVLRDSSAQFAMLEAIVSGLLGAAYLTAFVTQRPRAAYEGVQSFGVHRRGGKYMLLAVGFLLVGWSMERAFDARFIVALCAIIFACVATYATTAALMRD